MNREPAAEILRLEDERYGAMLAKDLKTLERLLDEELVYIHSSGVADGKESYLRGLREGLWDYQQIGRTEQSVKLAGDAALVFNRLAISIRVRGAQKELDTRALAVWVRRAGGWRLIALQSAALPKP
ncbi:MAG: nuclear transport factor 2 family protein [Betaproteobacteria bacterium]